MQKSIKKLVTLAYVTLVGAVYQPPILDIDLNKVDDSELADKIQKLLGSENVVITNRHLCGLRFPWDPAKPPTQVFPIEKVINYFFQEAVESDVFPLTKMRIYPVQHRWGRKGYAIVTDSEFAGSKEPIPNAIGMEIKPVYK